MESRFTTSTFSFNLNQPFGENRVSLHCRYSTSRLNRFSFESCKSKKGFRCSLKNKPARASPINCIRNSESGFEKKSFTPELSSPTEYNDSFFDLAFIHLCRKAFGKVANWQSSRSWKDGYLGMVEVSYALMRGKSAAEQQAAVLQGFPSVPDWFRKLFPYSDWGAEFNAKITPKFFQWLVGPCEVMHSETNGKKLQNVVFIHKCRYIETSGCVGMCVNLCKIPTQHFFTNELGMPLRMEPNFEDLSCKMIFGLMPLDPNDDEALSQPCFATCPSSNASLPMCHKLK